MENLFSIAGKVSIVTGGSSGIGKMIATGFVKNGVKTYIASRKKEVCDEVANELSEFGECIAIAADFSTMEGLLAFTNAFKKHEEKLDILINNAGATWGESYETFPEHAWDKIMNLNVKALFFLTRELTSLLEKAANREDPSRVINIASVAGLKPSDLSTFSYDASKAAVIHLTRTLAKTLVDKNILVNSISPGPFQSKMMRETLEVFGDAIKASNPRKRIGSQEDIIGTTIFLCSRASAYITGENIILDGGATSLS